MVMSSYGQYVFLITELKFMKILLRIIQVIQNNTVLSRIVQSFWNGTIIPKVCVCILLYCILFAF